MGSDLALLLFGSKSQSKRYGWCGGCCGAGGGLSVYCQASLGAGAQKPRYFPCQHRAAEWPWGHGANGLEIIENISICSPHWAAHYMLT